MSIREDDNPYHLAVTARCLRRDLELPDAVTESPDQQRQRHPLIEAFYTRRNSTPIGQETIEGLQANIVAYSLHAGRWRGLTWHDQESAIVWLLAGRHHRSGERADSYPHFRRLPKHQLLPSAEDYERVFDREARTFAVRVRSDVDAIMQEARIQRDGIVSGNIAGRIAVRAVEQDQRLQVSVKMQLYPSNQQVPAEWLMIVLAAFFPQARFEELQWGRELAGNPTPDDEYVFSIESASP